jgi:SAM-dependent methyltransferase
VEKIEYERMRQVEDRYWWFVSRRRMARRLLREFAPDAREVLDVGCGAGAFLAELPGGLIGTGLDFSEESIRLCRERGLPRLVQASAEAMPLPDAAFDAVVSLDTLEHVADDGAAAREIARVLRPGGAAILNVPAFPWLWGPHDVALHHHRRYTASSFRSLLEGAGLRIELLSYGIFFLFPLVAVIRLGDRVSRRRPEVSLPGAPGPLNSGLILLQDAETWLMRRLPLPWGSSVVAVVRRPAEPGAGP